MPLSGKMMSKGMNMGKLSRMPLVRGLTDESFNRSNSIPRLFSTTF